MSEEQTNMEEPGEATQETPEVTKEAEVTPEPTVVIIKEPAANGEQVELEEAAAATEEPKTEETEQMEITETTEGGEKTEEQAGASAPAKKVTNKGNKWGQNKKRKRETEKVSRNKKSAKVEEEEPVEVVPSSEAMKRKNSSETPTYSKITKEALSLGDYFEYVIRKEVIVAFPNSFAFKKFARSKKGLSLEIFELQYIEKRHKDNWEAQKINMLNDWKRNTGEKATVQTIRNLLRNYQTEELLKDVYLDEIIRAFYRHSFEEFALSTEGLGLDQHIVQQIMQEPRLQMLDEWRRKNGKTTPVSDSEIRCLLRRYLERDANDLETTEASLTPEAMKQQRSPELPASLKIRKQALSQGDLLKEVFRKEVIPAFANITAFKKFARSKKGLSLKDPDLENIVDHKENWEEQKIEMLNKWQQYTGEKATVQMIRNLLRNYLSEQIQTDQSKDVFRDKIIELDGSFHDIRSFEKFALSTEGLDLDQHIVQQIMQEPKLQMLDEWRRKNGKTATVPEIRRLLRRHLGRDANDYIVLVNGRFAIFRNHMLCERGQLYLGEQKNEDASSSLCAIKLERKNKDNLREARNLSKLMNHVNVVSILQTGTYRSGLHNDIFIAMELSWTNTLRNMLEDSIRLEIPFNEYISMNLVKQILRALDFIHSHDIIHRDLKPENVLLSRDWSQSKVANFGFSKTVTDGQSTRQTNQNVGTDGYRAPETYSTGAVISIMSDIYSAGVTIAEISSNGKHPFGTEPYLWSDNISNDKNLDLCHVRDPHIMNLIKLMLKMEPKDRPTAKKVLNDVQQFQVLSSPKNQQTTADQSSATSSITQRPTAEEVLNEVQQTTADQSLAASSMTQLQCPTAEEVLNEVQQTASDQCSAASSMTQLQCPTAEEVLNEVQQTTGDQSSAASSMTQIQRPTAEEVLNEVQQTTADQCLASAPMAELSEKENTIIMFAMPEEGMNSSMQVEEYRISQKKIYPFKDEEWSLMPKLKSCTAVVSGRYMYVLHLWYFYQLEYSDLPAKEKRKADISKKSEESEDYGEYPSVALLNGSVYVCGGSGLSDAQKYVKKYDADHDQWNFMCDMKIARTKFCVVSTKDHIYCIGGEEHQSVERFDEKKWEDVESLPRSINEASAAVAKNRIYVADHKGVLCYDIQKNSWSEMETKEWSFVKGRFVKILAVNEELYVIGYTKVKQQNSLSKSSFNNAIYHLEPKNGQTTLMKVFHDKKLNHHACLSFS